MSLEPFMRRPPESTLATGYQIAADGRRVDTTTKDEAKRRRPTAAVLRTVGIDIEAKEKTT